MGTSQACIRSYFCFSCNTIRQSINRTTKYQSSTFKLSSISNFWSYSPINSFKNVKSGSLLSIEKNERKFLKKIKSSFRFSSPLSICSTLWSNVSIHWSDNLINMNKNDKLVICTYK